MDSDENHLSRSKGTRQPGSGSLPPVFETDGAAGDVGSTNQGDIVDIEPSDKGASPLSSENDDLPENWGE
jgi:hypothetical protein